MSAYNEHMHASIQGSGWLLTDVLSAWHAARYLVIFITLVFVAARYLRDARSKQRHTDDFRAVRVEEKSVSTVVPRQALKNQNTLAPRTTENHVSVSKAPRRITQKKLRKTTRDQLAFDARSELIQPLIFFFSLGGTTEAVVKLESEKLAAWLSEGNERQAILPPQILDLSYIDFDDYFLSVPKASASTRYFYLIVVPTYNIDSAMNTFVQELEETHHDFRIDTAPLISLLGYSVFGFGDREGWPSEEEGYCSQAKEIDKWMAKLTSRKRAFPLGMGDVKSDWQLRLQEWRHGVQEVMLDLLAGEGLGAGVSGSGNAEESDVEDVDEASNNSQNQKKYISKASMDDVEDLGLSYRPQNLEELEIDFTTVAPTTKSIATTAKEMVPQDSPTFKSLTKQGYTIVGSHSGVKICRWTKSALRGRGSCYKFSFYGIKSHLCMETTPSLSCSNKCVFCWRHGTNPVGTTWRWKVDPPELIFNGVKEGHYKKIKMLKGVPGVRAERFAEAMQIRHCALSLVGEPIFYPHINEFLAMLHRERISSFLVCNAQHPNQLAALDHVTQLYVSIDASNKESLKKIDRPLHRDFWERFMRCLDILRERRFEQRTVFRLTLVKGFNIEDEAEGYADLVLRGLPCFIEVKGVTFCGTSTSAGAGLTMQNVPFYEEVCQFVYALKLALDKRGLDYGIAAEHAHSCCVLLGSSRFKIDGRWHTTIGYDKFFDCLESGKPFSPEDYIGEATPEWALWGNGGFDPRDERFYRKNRKEVTYIPSE